MSPKPGGKAPPRLVIRLHFTNHSDAGVHVIDPIPAPIGRGRARAGSGSDREEMGKEAQLLKGKLLKGLRASIYWTVVSSVSVLNLLTLVHSMHTTMMNFPYLPRQAIDGDSSFSPSTTPSPPLYGPGFFGKNDRLVAARPNYFQYYPHKYYRMPELQPPPRAIKRKDFTIEAILGLSEDSGGAYEERALAGPVRVGEGRREKAVKPYAVPEATPRTSLTALLPSSPEKSPEKYDPKCKSHRSLKDDSSPDNLYEILTSAQKTNPSCTNVPKSPSHGGKMKRIRTIFTPEQLERLESEFERQQYMVGPERLYLASTLNLSESQVKIWFQNRRIKWRKQHLELQQARLAQLRDTDTNTECDQEQDQSNSLARDSSPPVQHWDDC